MDTLPTNKQAAYEIARLVLAARQTYVDELFKAFMTNDQDKAMNIVGDIPNAKENNYLISTGENANKAIQKTAILLVEAHPERAKDILDLVDPELKDEGFKKIVGDSYKEVNEIAVAKTM